MVDAPRQAPHIAPLVVQEVEDGRSCRRLPELILLIEAQPDTLFLHRIDTQQAGKGVTQRISERGLDEDALLLGAPHLRQIAVA